MAGSERTRAVRTEHTETKAVCCDFQVQGLPIAPVAGASLAPEAFTIKSAYELFKDGDFDLGGKQVTFNPAPLPTGGFILSADGSAELIDLDEDWETADGILNITIGKPPPCNASLQQSYSLRDLLGTLDTGVLEVLLLCRCRVPIRWGAETGVVHPPVRVCGV